MKTIIVMAVHGAPPRDFPPDELREYFILHSRLGFSTVSHSPAIESRYEELEEKLKNWPRSMENDPFYAASQEVAGKLSNIMGQEVLVGFNEFCAPDVHEALRNATQRGATRVFVVSTMLTQGGEHAEKDISGAVQEAKKSYPEIEIIYAWPFETDDVALFMAEHIKKFFR